jgi:hypothetical protein
VDLVYRVKATPNEKPASLPTGVGVSPVNDPELIDPIDQVFDPE